MGSYKSTSWFVLSLFRLLFDAVLGMLMVLSVQVSVKKLQQRKTSSFKGKSVLKNGHEEMHCRGKDATMLMSEK